MAEEGNVAAQNVNQQFLTEDATGQSYSIPSSRFVNLVQNIMFAKCYHRGHENLSESGLYENCSAWEEMGVNITIWL